MWNIIVVGCNGIVKKWLDALKIREDVKYEAFVDLVESRADVLRQQYGPEALVLPELDDALKMCPDSNLVIDATPPFVHHSVVTKALAAGKFVIGEKPMAEDLNEALDMVKCAKESNQTYFVMQNRRFLNGIQTMRTELAKTYLGKPYLVCCDMFLGAHFMGPGNGKPDFRNVMEHPVLVDMLIHTFDEARYILGEAKAVSAYCQEVNPPNSWYKNPAIAICTFEFDDGSVLSLRGSWATKTENTTSHGAWRVYCTDGTICWDGDQKVTVNKAVPIPDHGYVEEEGIREEIPLSYKGREEHAGCVDAMMDALDHNTVMMTNCENNIHSLEMVMACIKSVETEKKVYIKDL